MHCRLFSGTELGDTGAVLVYCSYCEKLPALKRKLPLVEPMSQGQVEKIDDASMSILEGVVVAFIDDQAIEDWNSVGADIRDGDRVHLGRELVREKIKTIPEDFTYHARNPENSLPFGNDHCMFVPMTGAPYLRDLEGKRCVGIRGKLRLAFNGLE